VEILGVRFLFFRAHVFFVCLVFLWFSPQWMRFGFFFSQKDVVLSLFPSIPEYCYIFSSLTLFDLPFRRPSHVKLSLNPPNEFKIVPLVFCMRDLRFLLFRRRTRFSLFNRFRLSYLFSPRCSEDFFPPSPGAGPNGIVDPEVARRCRAGPTSSSFPITDSLPGSTFAESLRAHLRAGAGVFLVSGVRNDPDILRL